MFARRRRALTLGASIVMLLAGTLLLLAMAFAQALPSPAVSAPLLGAMPAVNVLSWSLKVLSRL